MSLHFPMAIKWSELLKPMCPITEVTDRTVHTFKNASDIAASISCVTSSTSLSSSSLLQA